MEDLQGLLEKINRDGVEKAEAEAAKIVAAAKARAEALVADARAEAERAKAQAAKAAEDAAARASVAMQQAARDAVLQVREAVQALLERILLQGVEKALADEQTAGELLLAAIKDVAGPGEVACGERLAQSLRAQLAARPDFTVVLDEARELGFSVRTDGGRVENAFTPDVIAAELARRLRPDLAKFMA